MGKISVYKDFQTFCDNLRMSDTDVEAVQRRYHSITKNINQNFWNSNSDTLHSRYVGSYGRGTCIYTSDIDVLVELPWEQYTRFNQYSGNGQSALLAEVRNSLKSTYSSSKISADGQVVDIDFSDGVKFEVVPAFKFADDSGYCYPDTNHGGSWKHMNPKSEIDCFNGRNTMCKGNLKKFCRMLRAWKNENYIPMNGILLDSIAYNFFRNYEHADKSFTFYDWISRDFFEFLQDNSDRVNWDRPGDNGIIKREFTIKYDVIATCEAVQEAMKCLSNDYYYTWHDKWREIYGTRFPAV